MNSIINKKIEQINLKWLEKVRQKAYKKPMREMLLWFCVSIALSGCLGAYKPQASLEGAKVGSLKARAKAQANLASGYIQLGRLDIAKGEVDKALAIDPSSALANNVAGLIAMSIKKNREAITYFNRALDADPDNPNYQNNLALLYCKNGSPSRGLALLKKALDNKLYIKKQNSLMNAGICSETMNNLAEAERYYTKAKKFNNVHFIAKEKLASIYLKTGRSKLSWRTINEVIVSASPATVSQLRLGIAAAWATNRKDDANRLSQKFKADYPDKSPNLQGVNNTLPTAQNRFNPNAGYQNNRYPQQQPQYPNPSYPQRYPNNGNYNNYQTPPQYPANPQYPNYQQRPNPNNYPYQ